MENSELQNKILDSIGSTEPSTFRELCQALEDDCPTDKEEWRKFFNLLRDLEVRDLVEVERLKGNIETLQLTTTGADAVRERLDSKRGLLSLKE